MPIDIETLFNSPQRKRFAFPGKIIWGCQVRFDALDLTTACRSVDLFVDTQFADHSFVRQLISHLGDRLRIRYEVAMPPGPQAIRALSMKHPTPPDTILAIGGGGTFDFAKGLLAQWLFRDLDGVGMGKRRGEAPSKDATRPLFVAMPTTAGSGAEASRYYVTYDETSRAKVHGKSWQLVADWILLDPTFLATAPSRLILHGAFDSFVHYMESLICQGEASWYGEMLSITGMKRIVSAWDRIGRLVDKEQLDTARLELLFAATLGGMAISNIRTGHIHEAAGALLEYTRLTHAETLFVFMQSACEDYSPNLDSRLAPLWQEFSALSAGLQFRSLTEVAGWWHHQFERVDALSQITCEVSRVCASAVVRQALFDRIWADRVWVEKESPIPLTADFISSFIDRSLSRFAKAGVVP